jgi:NAD(P)-dependent dehydrogenase (short-subunit alcohol dehydrogenase family)
MGRYSSKTAIVTGGGGGIGRVTAMRLASEGAAVVIVDRKPAAARAVATEIATTGGRSVAVVGSILSASTIKRAVAAAAGFGPLDLLVNNAAFTIKSTIAETSPADWDAEMDSTLKGAFLFVRAVLPVMVKQGRGAIVNIGSVNGLKYFGNPAYSAAKAGLLNLTQSIATEYGRHGIRANMVSPGTIATDAPAWVSRRKKSPELFKKLTRWYPVGRVGTPDDIAAAVAYLGADEAGFVSGANLVVDGGLTAGMGLMVDEMTGRNRGKK